MSSNPQPFTGYWLHPEGSVITMKQWGSSVAGTMQGNVADNILTTGEGKVVKLSKDAETAVLDGVELKRQFPELIVMCGPSGVGKGTLLHKLFAEYPSLFGFSISHTTRAPRPGEENGKDYHFISHDSIKAMIDQGEFVEFAEVHGNYYGTSKASVKAVQDTGKLCVLDIDIQGAQKVAKAGIPFVGVFVKPPSKEELEKRLRGRGTETEDKILKRLKNALGEIDFCDSHTFFTYELVNDNLDLCYKDLVHAISQSTRAPALPPMTHAVDATPSCGVVPVVSSPQATLRVIASEAENPQPFTGYWLHPEGTVITMKQWGSSVAGTMQGNVADNILTTGEGKVVKLSKDAETAVLDGVELKRQFPELIVMCGPSGVGKGTLLHKLFAEYPSLFGFSISHTTRAPRPGEENGKDYHFISHDSIKAMIDQGEFVEFAEVHGNYYGTSKASVKAVQDTGKLCVLDIDIQGAQKVAKAGIPFVGVFVKPPSREELEKRLRGRGTETEDKILKRLKNALGEIDFCDSHTFFTYELVNDDLDLCYKDLVHAISQSTRAPALPRVTHAVDATPSCGVVPVVSSPQATLRVIASEAENPQPFTGYWLHPEGTVITMKQWGSSVAGTVQGNVADNILTTGEGKVLKLSKDAETAVLDGVELKRQFPELIVMCGPSGVGKGTLLHKLFAEYPSLFGFSISHTTRAPRPGEENGKDYHFISHDSIKAMIDQGEFVEFAEVHGNYYGTSKASVKAVQDTGKLCVLDIDIQGAQKVAKAGIPFVGVFVKPPSREELEKRLRGRGTETEDKILKRLKNALGEIDFCDSHTFFTYELVNDNLDLCYKDLVHAISQSTRAPALPPMTHAVDATPDCGVLPSSESWYDSYCSLQ